MTQGKHVRRDATRPGRAWCAMVLVVACGACNREQAASPKPRERADLSYHFIEEDLWSDADLALPVELDACGDPDPSPECLSRRWGKERDPWHSNGPFTLPGEKTTDVAVVSHGVHRDSGGSLVLDTGTSGSYAIITPGCVDELNLATSTIWVQLSFGADVPPGTSLSLRMRAGPKADPSSPTWATAPFTPTFAASPIQLLGTLTPNGSYGDPQTIIGDEYLWIDVSFASSSPGLTPRLDWIQVGYKCFYSVGARRRGASAKH